MELRLIQQQIRMESGWKGKLPNCYHGPSNECMNEACGRRNTREGTVPEAIDYNRLDVEDMEKKKPTIK